MRKRRDYYEILGVSRSATQEEIKRAYRRLAKQFHPDRNPDPQAEKTFKEVQQAYQVLSQPEKRSQYDRFGEVGVGEVRNDPRGRTVYEWGGGSSVSVDDLEDLMSAFGRGAPGASIFEELLGGVSRRRSRPSPRRGVDDERELRLTFLQAARGATVTFRLRGTGTTGTQSLDVKIPPGVEEGQRIRVKGRGQPGANGGPPGDLFLVCRIDPHPYFQRLGTDIDIEVPVSVPEAVLGAKIEVPTLEGRATVFLPPGTPSGTRLRLKGHGLAAREGAGRGDLYVTVRIVAPKKLTPDQQRHYEALRSLEDDNPRASCLWCEAR